MHLFVLPLLLTFYQVVSESLVDFPLYLDDGNKLLQATLIDLNSGHQFFLKEFIYTSDRRSRGKIEITSDPQFHTVYYATRFDYSNSRLVIHENQCNKLEPKNVLKLAQISPNIDSFTNLLLLLGPSVFYRLKNKKLNWISGSNETIRGVFMNSLTAKIQDTLSITIFYKGGYYNQQKNPSRITFVDQNPGQSISNAVHVILDIYSVSNPDEDYEPIVSVKPGIGCPIYLNSGKSTPDLLSNQFQFIMRETFTLDPKSSTLYEIYVDSKYTVMKVIKTLDNGFIDTSFYDLNLKLVYKSTSEGICSIEAMDETSPGISVYGTFSLYSLMYISSYSEYLGKTFYDDQSKLKVEAFESTDYNKAYAGVTYDKLVITRYFAKSDSKETLGDYIPYGVTINGYNKNSKGKMTLVQKIERHFHDFGRLKEDEEFEKRFRPSDCHLKDQKVKTIAVHFKCEDVENEYNANLMEVRNTLSFTIRSQLEYNLISLARLVDIEYDLHNKEDIIAYISISSMPPLEYLFKLDLMHLSDDVWDRARKFTVDNSITCLSLAEGIIEAVVFDPVSKLCALFDQAKDIVYDEYGKSVTLYYTPFKNVKAILRQPELDDLMKVLKTAFKNLHFNCHSYDCDLKFTGTKAEDVTTTDRIKEVKNPIVLVSQRAQLSETDQVISIGDVQTFADCYKVCLNSEEIDCQTFSYCTMPSKSECRVSSLTNVEAKKILSVNSSCTVYSKNYLYDYIEVKHRKFIIGTTAAATDLIEDCASFCYPSEDCFSFQVCAYHGQCSFADVSYTDSNTEYSEDCSIYIPKFIKNYVSTGHKIVSKSLHTELNLDIDQCAALCQSWSNDDGQACLSFNYCHSDLQAQAICSINKDSVADATNGTIESENCINYQRKTDGKKKQKNTQMNVDSMKGTSKVGAFGIIILFLATGLIFGAVTPFIMTMIAKHNYARYSDT